MISAQLPRAGLSAVLRQRPLAATFELSGPGSGRISTWESAMYRNAEGSVRGELNVNGKKLASILDVPGSRLIILDEAQRTAVVVPYSSAGSQAMWGFNLKPTYTDDYKQILSVRCRKILFSDPAPKGEVWIAEELGTAMEDRQAGDGGEIVWHATSISTQTPPADLFRIPEGYTILQQ